jgi:hypothetical protein
MFFLKKQALTILGDPSGLSSGLILRLLLKIHLSHSTSSAFEGNADGGGGPPYRLTGGMIDWSNLRN